MLGSSKIKKPPNGFVDYVDYVNELLKNKNYIEREM